MRQDLGAELFGKAAQLIEESSDLGFNLGRQVNLWKGYSLRAGGVSKPALTSNFILVCMCLR